MNNNDLNRILSADELLEEMEKTETHPVIRLVVINVLPKNYFEDCRIKNSIHVESDKLASYVEDWDRTTRIILYEAEDETDLVDEACKILQNMGFFNVCKLEGGMHDWFEYGYPSMGECKMRYLHN